MGYFTLEQSGALTNTNISGALCCFLATLATPHDHIIDHNIDWNLIQLYTNVVNIMLQEWPSKIWCNAPLYMNITVCLKFWIELWCKWHTGLKARPSAQTYNRMRKWQHLPGSGSHGLFQDSSLLLSWSRHMGVAIYSLKHTKPHETHKNPGCKTEKWVFKKLCGKLILIHF